MAGFLKKGDALLIIDVFNSFKFKGGENLYPWAVKAAKNIKKIKKLFHAKKLPVIYANDNFSLWNETFEGIIKHCILKDPASKPIVNLIKPQKHDFLLLKARHSAFHSTILSPLLAELGVKRIFLCGTATNLCVLFTAHDAHMLYYKTVLIADCCASETDFDHDVALNQLSRFCGTKIVHGKEIS